MIDHTGVPVTDYERSKAFYLAALKPLGYELLMELPGVAGLGEHASGKPDFWLAPASGTPTSIHVAFHAASRDLVQRFHAAALAAGGRDNGGPGIRAHYHPGYYGAFVLDPDGHNIEAVCHERVPPSP